MEEKNAKKRAKMGRKRIDLSDPDTLEKVRHLAGLGLSDKAISISLGISPRTLARRKKDSVIFDNAIKEGKINAVQKVSNALFDSATGRNGEKPNISAQIFFLKNRGQAEEHGAWKDRLEQTTNYNVNLADIIGSRKQALSHSQGTLPPAPAKGIIINNDD
tara:strand:+ start:600 stop:1082 length:483 start_codon:yes stop_codon:yes gene_type:complete